MELSDFLSCNSFYPSLYADLRHANCLLPQSSVLALLSTLSLISTDGVGAILILLISHSIGTISTKRFCCDLSPQHESMGPKGGFCQFVFKQLYEKREYSKLLRLGEEFQEELSSFLKHHQDLQWLHEVFLHQFSSASETLHVLALSTDEGSTSVPEDAEATDHMHPELTLADRRRLLNLSKIAAMAGLSTSQFIMMYSFSFLFTIVLREAGSLIPTMKKKGEEKGRRFFL